MYGSRDRLSCVLTMNALCPVEGTDVTGHSSFSVIAAERLYRICCGGDAASE
jgi:hypothetical protein